MTYDGACDGNMESDDGVVRLFRMKIRSNRYDPTTWAKESKTDKFHMKISMKVTQQRITISNVNEINKEVIDVAFGNRCNAASRVVTP